ncbi:uncharacterized protein F5147DRAFT_772024 [Suillus discolor]|uniref:Uncharacterized protein n=1 Tax=Suillus discolor TaxID=1912936 RepID=A0A9P7FB28_9AGAM|nr:uncharacterized protein F5147DRAFT_772024 [Suillus discolor]KAG2111304.1 hypothetical protein F5147DRAFT_772024 [Suillus discolor]
MNNSATLIPSDQVIIAAKGNHITAADISHALFYANSRLLAMRLHVDKSFATAMPGYAQAFYTLMKWEMETFVTPFINICFITRLSAVIPKLIKDVLSIMTAHTLVDQQLDVHAILQDIKALCLSVDSNKSDDYDIAHMQDYFNDWWKDTLGCCQVSDMLPKSSVQDVMEFGGMALFTPYMVAIPLDWALYQTYLAGELVHEIFMSTILHRPVKDMDLGLLDIDTCIALEQLANVMATAYSNAVHLRIDMVRYNDALDKDESGRSENREEILFGRFPPEEERFLTTPSVVIDSGGRIIVWYLPGALTGMMVTDIYGATRSMGGLLRHSITTGKTSQWRTHQSNFHPSLDGMITPGCINISPAWFQQGRETHGFLNLDPEDGFSPEVSAALKGDAGHQITASLQRSGLIVSAALRVMHPDLYWAGMETQVRLGTWAARYQLDEMQHHL